MSARSIRLQQVNQMNESEPAPKPSTGGNPYGAMDWTELRRVASERGVVSWRRKREHIEADLVALDGAS